MKLPAALPWPRTSTPGTASHEAIRRSLQQQHATLWRLLEQRVGLQRAWGRVYLHLVFEHTKLTRCQVRRTEIFAESLAVSKAWKDLFRLKRQIRESRRLYRLQRRHSLSRKTSMLQKMKQQTQQMQFSRLWKQLRLRRRASYKKLSQAPKAKTLCALLKGRVWSEAKAHRVLTLDYVLSKPYSALPNRRPPLPRSPPPAAKTLTQGQASAKAK